ncbi:hypothetical protein OSTOST_07764 [Ostertagia ostertagi]
MWRPWRYSRYPNRCRGRQVSRRQVQRELSSVPKAHDGRVSKRHLRRVEKRKARTLERAAQKHLEDLSIGRYTCKPAIDDRAFYWSKLSFTFTIRSKYNKHRAVHNLCGPDVLVELDSCAKLVLRDSDSVSLTYREEAHDKCKVISWCEDKVDEYESSVDYYGGVVVYI